MNFYFNSTDIWTLYHSYIFDFSVWELWGALLHGGKLIVPTQDQVNDIYVFHRLCAKHRVTVLNQTPTAFYQFSRIAHTQDHTKLEDLRYIIFGGEALHNQQLSQWWDYASRQQLSTQLINMYGITETTIHATLKRLSSCDDIQSNIGRVLSHLRGYVLDESLNLTPKGVIGELYIGGAGLARAYFNHPELTQERFIDNPFVTEQDIQQGYTRLYKTGDLVRYLTNGDLEYVGRNDFQVKIRGHRVELSGIEHILSKVKGVQQCIVLPFMHKISGSDHKKLVVYYIASEAISATTFLNKLDQHLPSYMLPNVFIHIAELPLSITGKLDLRRLPNPNLSINVEGYHPPENEIQRQFCNVWQDIFSINKVGINDDFFRLGGDSIICIRMVSQLQEKGFYISVKDVYEHITISNLAVIAKRQPEESNIVYKPFSLLGKEAVQDIINSSSAGIEDIYPASYLQVGMLLEESRDENRAGTYHTIFAFQFTKTLNEEFIVTIWESLINKHPLLRTAFSYYPSFGYCAIQYQSVDVKNKVIFLSTGKIVDIIRKEKMKTFRISNPGLFKIYVIPDEKGSFSLVFSSHHVIEDGWSVASLIEEFTQAYLSAMPVVEENIPSYAEFVLQERTVLENESARNFWIEYLSDRKESINALKANSGLEYKEEQIECHKQLSSQLSQQVLRCSSQLSISPDVLFISAYTILLSIFQGIEDVTFGLVVNNRLEKLGGDRVFGLHLNTIPFRIEMNKEMLKSKWDIIKSVNNRKTKLYQYKQYPYGKIKSDLKSQDDLYFFAFNYIHFHVIEKLYLNNDIRMIGDLEKTNIPAIFHVIRQDNRFTLLLKGSGNFIDKPMADNLLCYAEYYLSQLVGDISTPISPLMPWDQQQLLYEYNSSSAIYPQTKTLTQLFEQQVLRTPDAIALTYCEKSLSYQELNRFANQVAHKLRKDYLQLFDNPLSTDTLIALYFDRSLECVIAMLAVLKAGGAYVPLAPAHPAARLQHILQDTQVNLVLTQVVLKEKLRSTIKMESIALIAIDTESFDSDDTINLSTHSVADDLAYVIYTSGTTGKPKGVMQTHANVARLFDATRNEFHFNSTDIWTLCHSYIFDFSVWELWGALLHGGKLIIPTKSQVNDVNELYKLCVKHKVTVLNQTPTAFFQFSRIAHTQDHTKLEDLRYIIFGGEALHNQQLSQWWDYASRQQLSTQLINMYGITETTIHATLKRLASSDEVQSNIGCVLSHLRGYVLNESLSLMPKGVIGELYIGGGGLARAYFNHPELTQERFIDNPFATEQDLQQGNTRLYKTGDLVRYLTNGDLEYIGRNDFQVKVRGHRIELAEIEKILSTIADIQESCVVIREVRHDKSLACFYLPSTKGIDLHQVKDQMRRHLPEYMIPSFWQKVLEFPLTLSGKLDRIAIQRLSILDNSQKESDVSEDNVQQKVVALWQQVLSKKKVGLDENFFDAGGHSINVLELQSLVQTTFNLDGIMLVDLFRYPTVRKYSKHLSSKYLGQ